MWEEQHWNYVGGLGNFWTDFFGLSGWFLRKTPKLNQNQKTKTTTKKNPNETKTSPKKPQHKKNPQNWEIGGFLEWARSSFYWYLISMKNAWSEGFIYLRKNMVAKVLWDSMCRTTFFALYHKLWSERTVQLACSEPQNSLWACSSPDGFCSCLWPLFFCSPLDDSCARCCSFHFCNR